MPAESLEIRRGLGAPNARFAGVPLRYAANPQRDNNQVAGPPGWRATAPEKIGEGWPVEY